MQKKVTLVEVKILLEDSTVDKLTFSNDTTARIPGVLTIARSEQLV